MNHYKEYGRDEGRDCTCSCPDADDERVGDECCPPDRTIFNWDTFEATACCPVGQVVSMTNTCVDEEPEQPENPCPDADDERVGDECCPPDRTIFNWDTFEAT